MTDAQLLAQLVLDFRRTADGSYIVTACELANRILEEETAPDRSQRIIELLESMQGDENGDGAWPISEALVEIKNMESEDD